MLRQRISFEDLENLGIIGKHGSEETTEFILAELSRRDSDVT